VLVLLLSLSLSWLEQMKKLIVLSVISLSHDAKKTHTSARVVNDLEILGGGGCLWFCGLACWGGKGQSWI